MSLLMQRMFSVDNLSWNVVILYFSFIFLSWKRPFSWAFSDHQTKNKASRGWEDQELLI